MTNQLVKIEDYLDEVARIFVSEGHSTRYDAPVLYLIKELESAASRSDPYLAGEFMISLEIVREKISGRLEKGLWS